MSERSSYKCPACNSHLYYEKIGDLFSVWCGYGKCPSSISNDGANAPTIEEALKIIEDNVEKENINNYE